jgi:hypothetical protein
MRRGVAVLLLAACGGSSQPPPVATVSVLPATASVAVGATVTFSATPKDAQGNPANGIATWSSSDATVATVSASGVATGVKAGGPIAISASVGTITGTAQLTVTAAATLFGLTIDNYRSWCDVTAKAGSTTVASFNGASAAISPQQASGTTISLTATPISTAFTTAKWQGTTTASGDANGDATYLMTTGASQTITACCPFSDGSGCPF